MKVVIVLSAVLGLFIAAACTAPIASPQPSNTATPSGTPLASPQPVSVTTPTPCVTVTITQSGATQPVGVASVGPANRTTPSSLTQATLSPEMLATLEARVQQTGRGGPTIAPGLPAVPVCPTVTPIR